MPLRCRLRCFASIWLVVQLMLLTAVVPRDCCAAHGSTHEHGDHQASEQCPMRKAGGPPCPMHQAQTPIAPAPVDVSAHDHHAAHEAPAPPDTDCLMRGVCGGPMATLMAQLSNRGILPASTLALRAPDAQDVPAAAAGHLIDRLEPPDTPPPRL